MSLLRGLLHFTRFSFALLALGCGAQLGWATLEAPLAQAAERLESDRTVVQYDAQKGPPRFLSRGWIIWYQDGAVKFEYPQIRVSGEEYARLDWTTSAQVICRGFGYAIAEDFERELHSTVGAWFYDEPAAHLDENGKILDVKLYRALYQSITCSHALPEGREP